MPPRRTVAGRKKRTYKSADVTQQLDEESQTLVEKTTPTRKLEFGQGQGFTRNQSTLSRAWEKDINAFLSNQRHTLYTHDPLLELQLDENENNTGEKLHQRRLSPDLLTTERFSDVQQERVNFARVLQEAENEEERITKKNNHNNNNNNNQKNILSINKVRHTSRSAATADINDNDGDDEKQLIVRGEMVDSSGKPLKSSGSTLTSPVHERNFSTPRLIETPECCAFKIPPVSQGTVEVLSALHVQDISPGEDANIIPFRLWQQQNQEKEIGLEGTIEGNTLLDTNDDGCMKSFSFPLDLTGKSCAQSTMDDGQQYTMGESEREKEIFVMPPLIPLKLNSSEEEEDAPLFKPASFARQGLSLNDTCINNNTKRPHYTVGMRVEGQWGRQWFSAVITEEEKNGYVQVRWDEDGSFLHLKVKEVRLPKEKITSNGNKVENKLTAQSVMTATQLVEIMDNETPQQFTLNTQEKGLNDIGNDKWISPTSLSLFLTQTARKYLGNTSSVLNTLVEHGALVVESLSQMNILNEEAISIWRRQRHHHNHNNNHNNNNHHNQQQGEEQEKEKYHKEMLFFVVTEEDTEIDDGIVIAVAHSMGVSTVSVEWLKRLEAEGLGENLRVCIPNSHYLIGQGNDNNVRGRILPRHKRFLSQKRIFITVDDADILLLINLCGGIIIREYSSTDEGLSPDYIYVAPGRRVQIAPDITSVALMEKSWLIHRIHEFFFSLQSSEHIHDDIEIDNNNNNNNNNIDDDDGDNNGGKNSQTFIIQTSGIKRPRQDEEEEEEFIENEKENVEEKNEIVHSPLLSVDRGMSRTSTPAVNALEVLEGEDYYFRLSQTNNGSNSNKKINNNIHNNISSSTTNEAPIVALGRVVRLEGNDNAVTMRLYEVKYTVMQQNPRTGNIDTHTTLYLGSRITTVSVDDLIFNIPVYVVDASQMRHVYTLESPPRDTINASCTNNNTNTNIITTAAVPAPAITTNTTAITTNTTAIAEKEVEVEEEEEEKDIFPFSRQINDSGTPLPDSIDPLLMSTPQPIDTNRNSTQQQQQQQQQQETVINETLINGKPVRPGVDVRFHDHLSVANTTKCEETQQSVGRVQMIQRAAKGVVLVVHKEEANSVFGGSKMMVITPDMVTDIV